jgi:hypothetical protein
MWIHCDDEGVHPYLPRQLKMECFPGDNFAIADIQAMLDQLIAVGLLYPYSNDGREYLHVTGWKHQKIDRPQPARYPGPHHERSTPIQIAFVEQSTNVRRTFVPDTIRSDRKGSDKDTIGEDGTREGESIGTGATSSRPRASRFTRPSLAEISAYCRERNNAVDPQRFLDYYDANGWRVGKNPMRNWQAAVRNWEKGSNNGSTARTPDQSVADYDARMKAKADGARAMLERFNSIGKGQTIEGEVIK